MSVVVKQRFPTRPTASTTPTSSPWSWRGDALRLVTQYGYVCTTEPYGQVDGDVELTGVDADSSYVYVLEYTDVLCGNCGRFTGRKMTLDAFLRDYADASLDIMDETCGFRQMKLEGFLNLPGRCLEFFLEVYYTGEIRYLLKD